MVDASSSPIMRPFYIFFVCLFFFSHFLSPIHFFSKCWRFLLKKLYEFMYLFGTARLATTLVIVFPVQGGTPCTGLNTLSSDFGRVCRVSRVRVPRLVCPIFYPNPRDTSPLRPNIFCIVPACVQLEILWTRGFEPRQPPQALLFCLFIFRLFCCGFYRSILRIIILCARSICPQWFHFVRINQNKHGSCEMISFAPKMATPI